MTLARTLGASLSFLFVALGCSFADPQAGAPQAACGIGTGGGSQAGPGASYYGTSASSTMTAPTCATNSGSTCDDCESTHCCATRSACYGDPVCACADEALDECLDATVMNVTAAGAPAQTSGCWNVFSAKGTVEQARVACQRAWCQTECGIP